MKKFLTIFLPILVFGSLTVYIIWRESKAKKLKDALVTQINSLTEMVTNKSDSLAEYETLVDNYQFSERKLKSELSTLSADYAASVKATDARILNITKANLILKSKIDTLQAKLTTSEDGRMLNLTLNDAYPDFKDPFITYQADVQVDKENPIYPQVVSKFEFSPLKINTVLTERDNGAWTIAFNGPDFIKPGDISVHSLPAKQYAPSKPRLKLVLGAGVDFVYVLGPTMNIEIGTQYGDWRISARSSIRSTGISVTKLFTK